MTTRTRIALLTGLLAAAVGCTTPGPSATRPAVPREPILRVGITPDFPPMAFRENKRLTGVEVDLAMRLGPALGRTVRFVELPWGELVPALLADRIDIIMSGMTVTRAREFRVAFADPYLKSGLLAVRSREETNHNDTVAKVLETADRVGATEGTVGERFVREHMPYANLLPFHRPFTGITELRQGHVDLYVDDMPVMGWYVSAHESDLAVVLPPLTEDQIAWAFRPGNEELRSQANAVLAGWRQDGTLSAVLKRWLRLWPWPL